MKSSTAFASFEFSVEACEPPLDHSFGSSMRMPDSRWVPKPEALEIDPSKGVLIENSGEGVCYRLLRRSDKKIALSRIAPFPESHRTRGKVAAADSERRSNIGHFQRVLVAEDHKGMRCMLVQMLHRWGFETVVATKGADVLRFMEQKRHPELVILRRKLADVDVLELCRQLRDHRSDCSPYILLIAENNKQDVACALEAGASACLTAPFEAHELRAHLMAAVRTLNHQECLLNSRDRYRLLATKDALTGVWNRRSIEQILNDELDRAAGAERATGVLLIDLDHFKRVNDTYGHLAGDFVLQEVARRLKNALRPYDAIGRYGGEEFLIVVPSANERELCQLAERLGGFISKDPIPVGKGCTRITLSVGVAIAPPRENSSRAIEAVDASLYQAKRLGRNCFVYGGQRIEESGEGCAVEHLQLVSCSEPRLKQAVRVPVPYAGR
jgi:two-component system cell cycle response regulator